MRRRRSRSRPSPKNAVQRNHEGRAQTPSRPERPPPAEPMRPGRRDRTAGRPDASGAAAPDVKAAEDAAAAAAGSAAAQAGSAAAAEADRRSDATGEPPGSAEGDAAGQIQAASRSPKLLEKAKPDEPGPSRRKPIDPDAIAKLIGQSKARSIRRRPAPPRRWGCPTSTRPRMSPSLSAALDGMAAGGLSQLLDAAADEPAGPEIHRARSRRSSTPDGSLVRPPELLNPPSIPPGAPTRKARCAPRSNAIRCTCRRNTRPISSSGERKRSFRPAERPGLTRARRSRTFKTGETRTCHDDRNVRSPASAAALSAASRSARVRAARRRRRRSMFTPAPISSRSPSR